VSRGVREGVSWRALEWSRRGLLALPEQGHPAAVTAPEPPPHHAAYAAPRTDLVDDLQTRLLQPAPSKARLAAGLDLASRVGDDRRQRLAGDDGQCGGSALCVLRDELVLGDVREVQPHLRGRQRAAAVVVQVARVALLGGLLGLLAKRERRAHAVADQAGVDGGGLAALGVGALQARAGRGAGRHGQRARLYEKL